MALSALFNWISGNAGGGRSSRRALASKERLQQYGRFLRAYQGYSIRGVLDTGVMTQWRRLKFNYNAPVVNISAGWFAAKGVNWSVPGNPDGTRAAADIWARSGGDAALLENAVTCSIYGDLVGLAARDDDGKPVIEFVDPSICDPVFDGSDYSRLAGLEIVYEEPGRDGRPEVVREFYERDHMETWRGDVMTARIDYGLLPACWIRNTSVKGIPFGIGDIEPIWELVEEYDHLSSKQTRIVDYYSSPHLVVSGIQKPPDDPAMTVGTIFYVPVNGDVKFIEWSGAAPAVGDQLARCRQAISEISQVPEVAFGHQDSASSANLTGLAMQVLFGPLVTKTERKQASWGPALQWLMWLCLRQSGFKTVGLHEVQLHWPTATPVDGQAVTAVASAKVASRTSSRRTVMSDLGIKDPDAELARIIIEEKALQLVEPMRDTLQDANTAARAGARGLFAAESHSAAQPGDVAERTATTPEDVRALLAALEALLGALTPGPSP